jgi:hypothetical protein
MRWMLTERPGGKGYYRYIFNKSLVDDEYARCLKGQFLCDTIYAVAIHEK